MTEIEHYQPPTAAVDSWVDVLAPVGDLAARIAGTEFVPETLRGKPAAVAAAILTGRELGIGPMTALRHVHIVKGKPGQSAELMRALVLREGHQLRYVETTTTRCIVEGRRRGDEDWTKVQFTADDAKRAQINLGTYPEDKLVARATSRLCRRIFADLVLGMPYSTEELEDLPANGEVPEAPIDSEPAPTRRTAKRAPQPKAVERVTPAEAKAAPEATVPDPGLPGEADNTEEYPQPEQEERPDNGEITKAQLAELHRLFRDEVGNPDRDERLQVAAAVVGRPLTSSADLTKAEASTLIDVLTAAARYHNPLDRLRELIASTLLDAEVIEEGGDQ